VTAFASSVARSWVRLYTRGIPSDLRDARRAEIESDIWEHRQAEPAVSLLLRVILGVPADLVWRVEHRQGGLLRRALRRMGCIVRGLRHNGWLLWPMFMYLVWLTGGLGLGVPSGVGPYERLTMFAAAIVTGAGILLLRGRAPRLGATLVAAGCLPLSVVMVQHAPLLPIFALLAVRAALNRRDALRAAPPA
jgi:hypothetical protein